MVSMAQACVFVFLQQQQYKFSISVLFGSAVAVSTSPSVQYAGSAGSAGNSSIVAGCAGPGSTSIASSSTVP